MFRKLVLLAFLMAVLVVVINELFPLAKFSLAWVIIGLVVYIIGGIIFYMIPDYLQPRINQPDYVRNPGFWIILFVLILWPVLLFGRIRHYRRMRRRG